MVSCTVELKRADCREVDEHEIDLIDNEISDSYVWKEEPSIGPAGDYMTRSGVEKLMGDKIKAAVEVDVRLVVTGIV